jgi:hypothetical protein
MKSQELKETFFMAHGFTQIQRIYADILNTKAVMIYTLQFRVYNLKSKLRS